MQHPIDKERQDREEVHRVLKDLVHRVILFDAEDKRGVNRHYCGYIVETYPDDGKVVRLWLTHLQTGDSEWTPLASKAEWRGSMNDKRLKILDVTIKEARAWQKKKAIGISTSPPSRQSN